MMKILVKPLILFVLVASASLTARANGENFRVENAASTLISKAKILNEFPQNNEWTVLEDLGSIKIEYRFQECTSQESAFTNYNVLFLKFTNSANKAVELTYTKEVYYDGVCFTCDENDIEENTHTLTLQPNSVLEGTEEARVDGLWIFSNFVELSPGMMDRRITNLVLTNIETKVIK